jgi:epoxide hydrolase-like predicted phosphatase
LATPQAGAVVFDFGGVLITTIANQVGKVAASHSVEKHVMHEVLLGPRSSGDHPWHCAERGELPVADIQSQLAPWAAASGIELHGDEISRLLAAGEYTVIDEMVECVADVRAAGLLTGLLTNTFNEFHPTLERDLDLSMFDAVIESCAVGTRKPEAAIYLATAAMLEVPHDQIVYLDDFEQNLGPATSLGWTTILVGDPGAAITEVRSILGGSGYYPK